MPPFREQSGGGVGRTLLLTLMAAYIFFSVLVLGSWGRLKDAVLSGGGQGGGEKAKSPFLVEDVAVPSALVPIDVKISNNGQSVVVKRCQLDRDAHYREPYRYPMFKDLVAVSRCGGGKSTSLESIEREIEANPSSYLEPSGFVFHMARCGSTLVANMLAASPRHIVYSESAPPPTIFKHCPGCSPERQASILRTVILAMGKVSLDTPNVRHEYVFFKFQSSTVEAMHVMLDAFPRTPWIFVFREPVPVVMSLLGTRLDQSGNLTTKKSRGNSPCLRHKSDPPQSVLAVTQLSASELRTGPDEQYCAAHIAVLCQTAADQVDLRRHQGASEGRSGGWGLPLNYGTLPEALPVLLHDHFKAPLTADETIRAMAISDHYSKARGPDRAFEEDTEKKVDAASEKVTKYTDALAVPQCARLFADSLSRDQVARAEGIARL